MKALFFKYYIVVILVVVVALGGGIYWYVRSSAAPSFSAVTASQGNVVESVDLSGNVLSEDSTALSFQESGQISQVFVNEGDVVPLGATLVTLDQSALNASVEQANAALAAAQANLDQLTSGTRPEQLQIDQSAVTSAVRSLDTALENAYSASDDAVRNQLDNLFANVQTTNPTFLIPDSDSQRINDIQSQRVALSAVLSNWYNLLNATSSDMSSSSGFVDSALQQINTYTDTIALSVNAAIPGSTIPVATLAQYKADVATARSEIQGSISAVTGAESALTAAQNELALANAGATSQSIEAQKAVVLQAQAALASAQVALSHATLLAPFGGTVQNLTAVVGQVVSPGTPVLSLINNSGLKIETYISETDLGKIKDGDTADVTLDAYGTGTVFPATVTTIDSAETQVNGSAAYLVTLHFVDPDGRIKEGMTANVHIIAAEHDNVLEVPSRLVINNGNSYFVLVKNGNVVEQRPVTIGIVGDDGMTEIISGLNEGDQITNF